MSAALPARVGELLEAAENLGWIGTKHVSRDEFLNGTTGETCLLTRLYKFAGPDLKDRLGPLLEQNVSLRAQWKRRRHSSIDRWIGPRLYLSHASNFDETRRWSSIVSSRLGRHFQQLPNWTSLLDAALRDIQAHRSRILLSPKTTLHEATQEFARAARIETLRLELDQSDRTLARWLESLLNQTNDRDGLSSPQQLWQSAMWISPELGTAKGENPSAADDDFSKYPVQDRLTISLADTVYALSIRAKGTLDALLHQRLRDDQFPPATVFIFLGSNQQQNRDSQWLERGAIGRFVVPPVRHQNLAKRCRPRAPVLLPSQQLVCPVPAQWQTTSGDDWTLLTHCTRGSGGRLPNESDRDFRVRMWTDNRVRSSHPIETLYRICDEGTLRGTSGITRTDQTCVSFSQVPLPSLLSRRKYRSHLGRWDWEPYGVMISRDVLERMGARSVVYGGEQEYAKLPVSEQVFFQPTGKTYDWTAEQEWRILGDLCLRSLPPESVRVFVRTFREAQQFARDFQWPVYWVEAT